MPDGPRVMNRIEQRFTSFMEAIGDIICRIGAFVSITWRRHRPRD
jgi:hypothetical protein